MSPPPPPLLLHQHPIPSCRIEGLILPALSDRHGCPETLSPGYGQAHCQSPCKPEREQERRYLGKPLAIPSALRVYTRLLTTFFCWIGFSWLYAFYARVSHLRACRILQSWTNDQLRPQPRTQPGWHVRKKKGRGIIYWEILLVNRLMRESSIRSRKAGEKQMSANSVRKVTEVKCHFPTTYQLRRWPTIILTCACYCYLFLENVAEIQGLIESFIRLCTGPGSVPRRDRVSPLLTSCKAYDERVIWRWAWND